MTGGVCERGDTKQRSLLALCSSHAKLKTIKAAFLQSRTPRVSLVFKETIL